MGGCFKKQELRLILLLETQMKNCENILRWLLAGNTIKMWLLYLLLEAPEMIDTRTTGNILVGLKVGRADSFCPAPTCLARTPPWAAISACLTLSATPQATFQITRCTPCILARGGQG